MSWSRRSFLAAPLALAACGFTPVYAPGGTASKLQNRVKVSEQNSREGYLLLRRFEERLGRADTPSFDLRFNLSSSTAGLAIDPAGDVERFDLIATLHYELWSLETGQLLTKGSVDDFTGYSASGSTVATQAAERDARERLMTILADEVVVRLHATEL